MKFFLDACIAPRLARALATIAEPQKLPIVHLSEKFDRSDIEDPEWIRALASEGDWIIVSGDTRISRSRAERAAWHESRLTAFFLDDGWASRGIWAQSAELIRWWPALVLEAQKAEPGSGYKLGFRGKSPTLIYKP